MTPNTSRYQVLPLFDPHRPDFVCNVEVTNVPPIDAQAEAWFLEARALENPDTSWEEDRDYQKIVDLTAKAAQRRHWKALLNLASLYAERRDPVHGVEDAVKLVEDGMRLGIPAAYDRMGTYYMNGVGVGADSTKAYAFWQRAADMGNPHAMTYLAEQMKSIDDRPEERRWSNLPVALKMLECAFAQGDGQAAYYLEFIYRYPRNGPENTRAQKARALEILHQAVKFGCADCADMLQIDFGYPFSLADMIAPHVDKARAERYGVVGDALSRNPSRRFPNLDKVLPLPPAELPHWDGDKQTLLAAAEAVTLPSPPAKPSAASQRTGRHFLDAAFQLRRSDERTDKITAPWTGYWEPTAPNQSADVQAALARVPPGLYRVGETFERLSHPDGQAGKFIDGITWEHWLTLRHDHDVFSPQAAPGAMRKSSNPQALAACSPEKPCPASGTWQPWLSPGDPMSASINQPWRQAWIVKGAAFPSLAGPWPLTPVIWHLVDNEGVHIG